MCGLPIGENKERGGLDGYTRSIILPPIFITATKHLSYFLAIFLSVRPKERKNLSIGKEKKISKVFFRLFYCTMPQEMGSRKKNDID